LLANAKVTEKAKRALLQPAMPSASGQAQRTRSALYAFGSLSDLVALGFSSVPGEENS
jgi:hypothetical protein